MKEEEKNKENAQVPLLKISDLEKHFVVKGSKEDRVVYALNGISFSVNTGETFGLVGESGCGKTTAGRVITCLTKPTAGKVFFDGKDMFSLSKKELKKTRRHLQIVFQDPFASLDPRMTVGKIISEPLVIHGIGDKKSRQKLVEEFMEIVGLQPSYYHRYPHEFSGGQRQRIGIARALVLRPKLIICDEPVSALDVSVQSQILNLLVELQENLGLTYIFIAHGLNVVKHVSNRIGVMYLGKMVEIIGAKELFENAAHPYTQALLSAVPVPDPGKSKQRIILDGDIPSPSNLPSGCFFHTRCKYCQDICRREQPSMRQFGDRMVVCHFPLT
ncbi:MAG: dipeptide ABC transporter ATP-binding protein [Dehalobacterium sp.]